MDFDLKSPVEDESVSEFNHHMLLFALGLAGMFIFPIIFAVILVLFLPNTDSELLNYLAYFLGYGTYIGVLAYFLKKDKIKKILKGINLNNFIVAIIFTIILFLSSLFVSTILTLIFGDGLGNSNQGTLEKSLLNYPVVIFVFTVIVAPIVEELVFRFSIFRPLSKNNRVLAYIVTVLFFAGIHFISSFGELAINIEELGKEKAYSLLFEDFKTLPIYIVGAFVLTLSYDINKNISTNIMIHMFYNGLQLMLMIANIDQLVDKYQSSSLVFLNFNELKNIIYLIGI